MAAADDTLALVEAVGRGDRDAIDVLLRRYLPEIRAFVRLRTGPLIRAHESSSDLVQSVCRDVLEHPERLRYPSETAFKRWLYTTALRKIADRQEYWLAQKRDARRERPCDDEALAALYHSFSTPSRALALREQRERVEAVFEELSPEHREVITLAHVVGLSRAEIADQMGRSEVAVRALLHRALARVSALLGE